MGNLKYMVQGIWLVCGILLLVVLLLVVNMGMELTATVKHVRDTITIEDIRLGLNVIEKELDANLWDLMIQQQRSLTHLEYTPENWQAFLDFCERTGYVVSDSNWQRFISGQLSYK